MGTDRFTRPHLARTDPIRSFWTIFGPAGESPAGADPIARGVEAGYRVIEDYLRRGRESARTMAPGAAAPPPFEADAVQGRMLSIARLLTEAASAWMDVLGVAAPPRPGGAPGPFSSNADAPAGAGPASHDHSDIPSAAAAGGSGRPGSRPGPEVTSAGFGPFVGAREASPKGAGEPVPQGPAPAAVASPRATALELTLAGPPRVHVSLYLRGRASAGPLRTSDLRADPDPAGATPPPIRGAEVVCPGGDDPVEVRLPGLAAHAPGCYRGVIVDERTSVTAGTLTILVGREA